MFALMAGMDYELFMPPFRKFSGQPQKYRNRLQPDSLKIDKIRGFFTQQQVIRWADASLAVPPNPGVGKWGKGASFFSSFDPSVLSEKKADYKSNPVKFENFTITMLHFC